jgi:cell wall-associated NlpC family hydrolase
MCLNLVKTIFLVLSCAFFLLATPGNIAQASGQDLPVLQQGDTNDAIYTLQAELKKIGFYQYNVDGNFGSLTKLAVIQFQQTVGIEDDGVVGSETWLALQNYLGNNHTASRGKFDRNTGQQIAGLAQQFLGVPYVWAGSAPTGFDCSGFVYYIYSRYGISLPRMADEQYNIGHRVPPNAIQPGDLVFYSTYIPGPSHVGIYVGNGQFIHASSGAGEVTLTAMSKPYYQARFLGAFRVVNK